MSNFDWKTQKNYEDLITLISFEGFEWDSKTFYQQERDLLQPRMEALGYTEIIWLQGETDSFGPLTRVCRAFDKDGELHWFVYG